VKRTAEIALAAAYAAMYVVLIAVFPYLSFLQLNVRVANVLKGLVKFWPVGTLLGNLVAVVVGNYLFSPLGLLDVLLSPLVSTALLAVAYLVGKKSFFVGLVINAVGLGIYLSWLLSTLVPGLTFVGLLPLLLAGVAISDVALPYTLYRSLAKLKIAQRRLGGPI
jgi:QueT transporter